MTTDETAHLFVEALHGEERRTPGDPLQPVIAPASVYHLPGAANAEHQYGRWSNPTWTALEMALGRLLAAEAVAFPSGMAAIAAVLFTQLRPGDRALLPRRRLRGDAGAPRQTLTTDGRRRDLHRDAAFDATDFDGYRLVWIETPSNPTLDVCDLKSAAARARTARATLVVDNTTSTPLGQRPLDLGADIVVASDTKALSGHSDTLMGHAASRNPAAMAAIRGWRTDAGAILGRLRHGWSIAV